MPKNLNKIVKKLSKKRGKLDSLHENSRDAKRLRRAGGREDKLARAAAETIRGRQIYDESEVLCLAMSDCLDLTRKYVNRLKPELEELQQARRKGRPLSKREEVLGQKSAAEEKEFLTGFWMPDLESEESIKKLKNWNGEWSSMSNLVFIRLTEQGGKQPSNFPPKVIIAVVAERTGKYKRELLFFNARQVFQNTSLAIASKTTTTTFSAFRILLFISSVIAVKMFSLRTLTRSVPRSLSRAVTSASIRPLPRAALRQSSWKLATRPAYSAFSTSSARFESPGQVDVELAAKFQSELALETESGETDQVPESLKYFLDNGPFELRDTAGEEEIVLTRSFGDEKIRVSFTIADIQNIHPEEDFVDSALQDEYTETKAGESAGKLSEEGLEEEPLEPGYVAHVNVTIEKPGRGAMHFDTVARDGMIQIENVSYFNKSELANAQTPEQEWKRQSLYSGPPFGNLDEDLQLLLERYLDERGIDTALAAFVPDYIDFKEQKEYTRWLSNLNKFVESN
ncbi:hypothetical protein FQN57_002182 [Myotisia sp. PD_48]|nr:hypothetical protein FQN57_002182 [Myotisia sp. PD_48]